MTTKKSNLLKYVILLFIIALSIFIYLKASKHDNSEAITKVTSEPIKVEKKLRTKHIEQVAEITEDTIDKEEALQKQRLAYKTNVKKSINQALMFKTPESIMKVIMHYQGSGDDEKANEYIELLLKKFPDYQM